MSLDSGQSEFEPVFDELLRKAKSGDPEALGILLDHHRPYLLNIANRELPPIIASKVGASDVVQNSMLTAHRFFERFEGATALQLRAWLRKILVNAMQHQRRAYLGTRKRNVSRERDFQSQSKAMPLVDPRATPQTNAALHEQTMRLFAEIEKLPEDHRLVIQLHTLEGLSFQRVGALMSRSPEAAWKLWTRAMLRLGKLAKF